MSITITNRAWLWAPAAVLAMLAMLAVLVLFSSPPTRGSVLQSLQQPATYATADVGPGSVNTVVTGRPYTLGIRMAPNRPALRNALSVRLTDKSRPVSGARVTVTFSMPSMNMQQGYTSELRSMGDGVYSADEPVLGMPGVWQLSMQVQRPGSRPLELSVDDRMR